MNRVTINGREYTIPEVDFDTICQLEENGVYLLNMDRRKLATMVRGLVAWIMDVDTRTASMEIQAHIQNGGDIAEILTKVTDAVNNSGFFKGREEEPQKVQKLPQDHRKKNRNRNKYKNENTQA